MGDVSFRDASISTRFEQVPTESKAPAVQSGRTQSFTASTWTRAEPEAGKAGRRALIGTSREASPQWIAISKSRSQSVIEGRTSKFSRRLTKGAGNLATKIRSFTTPIFCSGKVSGSTPRSSPFPIGGNRFFSRPKSSTGGVQNSPLADSLMPDQAIYKRMKASDLVGQGLLWLVMTRANQFS